jgi:hypothetical protein
MLVILPVLLCKFWGWLMLFRSQGHLPGCRGLCGRALHRKPVDLTLPTVGLTKPHASRTGAVLHTPATLRAYSCTGASDLPDKPALLFRWGYDQAGPLSYRPT